jgi:hypothetical protein
MKEKESSAATHKLLLSFEKANDRFSRNISAKSPKDKAKKKLRKYVARTEKLA